MTHEKFLARLELHSDILFLHLVNVQKTRDFVTGLLCITSFFLLKQEYSIRKRSWALLCNLWAHIIGLIAILWT